jgi:hypothetical protein
VTQYAGADAFPSDFTIPDDTAPPTAAQLLVAIEALGDRTRWAFNRTGTVRVVAEGATTIADGADALAVVTLGGNPATFASSSYGGNPATLPLASIPGLLVGDVVEVYVEGTIKGTGLAGGVFAKTIVNDGSVFDVPGQKISARVAPPEFKAIAIDDDPAYGTRSSWNVVGFGTPYVVMTLANLLAGDLVEIHGQQSVSFASSVTPSNDYGELELVTKENAGAYALEPGAHLRVFNTPAAELTDQRALHALHSMAAPGTLTCAIQGQVSAAVNTNRVFLSRPISYFATIQSPGSSTLGVALVGRYVTTHAGTLGVGLDGKSLAATSSFSFVGAFVCRWRVLRSNA